MVERLPNMHKVLDSIPSTEKDKEKERKKTIPRENFGEEGLGNKVGVFGSLGLVN